MELITIRKYFKKMSGLDRFLIGLVVVGVIVSVVSIFRGILMDRQVQVEYLSGGNTTGMAQTKILVDIEGSVMNPGVYELTSGSRIKDVLVMAGGLSDKADRIYCEKNLNMAEEIKDGEKIYIPNVVNTSTQQGYIEANNLVKKININTATTTELDTLVGVGSVRAEAIVKNRPYKSLDDLVSKKALTQSILDKNKDLLTVF